MPDEPTSNAKNEPAVDFIQREIERTTSNLHCAINTFGHSAIGAANPVPWFKRYPLKASIVAGAALAGGTVCILRAIRRKPEARHSHAPPVNIYIKKPKSQSNGWSRLGAALLATLTAKLSEGVRTTISNSFSDKHSRPGRTRTAIDTNPKLQDFDI